MSILAALYQELIVEHQKNPRNYGEPAEFDFAEEGVNPSCGDSITLFLSVENDTVTAAHFTGEGCAISQAATSILTGVATGKTVAELQELYNSFMHMLQGADASPALGDLAVFSGVAKVPARVKCAALGFSALRRALFP